MHDREANGGSFLDCAFFNETQPQMVPGWRSKAWSLQSTRDASRASTRMQQWEGAAVCAKLGVQTPGKGQTDIQQEQVGQPPTQSSLLLTRVRA